MKYAKNSFALVASLLLMGASTFARNPGDAKTEEDRLQNAGKVMQEILNVQDNIPQDLLDKARCVVVMPSVLKAAFVVGGSYGRGAMVRRTGKEFSGPWGAPAMCAPEGGSGGLQIGAGAPHLRRLVIKEPRGASAVFSRVQLGPLACPAPGTQ